MSTVDSEAATIAVVDITDVAAVAAGELSDTERSMLEFERQWWRYPGSKEDAIRELFGSSPTRYYQMLNTLIDTEAALAFDAVLVKRLRRLRHSRHRSRRPGL